MSKFFFAASLIAALGASSAHAGGFSAPVVDVAPVGAVAAPLDWAGGYVGANLSYGMGDHRTDFLGAAILVLSEPDGISGAVRAGYDWQVGKAVFGIGADYNIGKYKDSDNALISGDFEIKNAASVYGRAGYLLNDNLIGYGLIGYTRAKFAMGGMTDVSENIDGLTLGFGAEYRFNSSWSGYAEYTHTDFGDLSSDELLPDMEVTLGQIKLGVNYRF